jgi:hypothetical protein
VTLALLQKNAVQSERKGSPVLKLSYENPNIPLSNLTIPKTVPVDVLWKLEETHETAHTHTTAHVTALDLRER